MRRRDGIPHRKIAPDRSDPGRLILDWGQFAGAGWAAGAVSAAGAGSSGAGNGVACGSVAAGASTGVEGAGAACSSVAGASGPEGCTGVSEGTCSVAGCPAPTETQAHSWGATDQATGMRTCTVCGAAGKDPNWTAPPAEHVHAWSGWTDAGDGANHKRTCSAAGCPAPTELQPHTWGTTDPSTGARSCTVCGAGGQDPNWAPPATTPIPAPAA